MGVDKRFVVRIEKYGLRNFGRIIKIELITKETFTHNLRSLQHDTINRKNTTQPQNANNVQNGYENNATRPLKHLNDLSN